MVKTFVISKNQIAVTKARLVENGFAQEEVDTMKGSDVALNYKIVNELIPGPKDKTKREAIFAKFACLIGFSLVEHKEAPKPATIETPAPEATTEMPTVAELPSGKSKNKNKNKEAEITA